MNESGAESAAIVEPIGGSGFCRLCDFARRAAAFVLGVGAAFISLWIASCLFIWLVSFATDDRNYLFFGFSWRTFLQALIDPRVFLLFLGAPIVAIICEGLSAVLTRPDRVSGVLKRGRISWVAGRYGTFGLRLAILDLFAFALISAYRVYVWGYF